MSKLKVVDHHLSFEQMMEAIKTGKRARNPDCSPGWVVAWDSGGSFHYWINPHTGSTPRFHFSQYDRERKDWQVVQ